MRTAFLIFLLALTLGTVKAENPFNIDPENTILFVESDSLWAHTGQASPLPYLTNMFLAQGHAFHAIYNVAENGDYLDSSGGIMDEYTTQIQPFIDLGYTCILILHIGANNSALVNEGEHTNLITDFDTYCARAVADGLHLMTLTILPQYRSTNAITGTQYEIERGLSNVRIKTAPTTTWCVDNEIYFPVSSITDSTKFVDNPPLHWTELGAANTATNVYLAWTTNAVPPRYFKGYRADYLELEINLSARAEPPVNEPEEDPRFHAFAQFKRAPGIHR